MNRRKIECDIGYIENALEMLNITLKNMHIDKER